MQTVGIIAVFAKWLAQVYFPFPCWLVAKIRAVKVFIHTKK